MKFNVTVAVVSACEPEPCTANTPAPNGALPLLVIVLLVTVAVPSSRKIRS